MTDSNSGGFQYNHVRDETTPVPHEEEHADVHTDDDDDEAYQPSSTSEDEEDEEDEESEAFLARLLRSIVEENGEENEDGNANTELVVETGNNDESQTEVERSEPYIFTLIQTMLLIFRIAAVRQRQMIRLLQNSQIGRLFHFVSGDELQFEDDEDEESAWRRWTRRPKPDPNRFPKVPSDKGRELMNSGIFGSDEVHASRGSRPNNISEVKKLARRILDRELATEDSARRRVNQRLMAQGMIPSSKPDMVVHYDDPVYSGQFSDDGNFFFSVNKDFKVRMYDTTNPYKWRYYKTVLYPFGQSLIRKTFHKYLLLKISDKAQWTLTDASLSPDNRYLAYSSIRSTVCLAPTDPNDHGDPYSLDLSGAGDGRPNDAGFRSGRGSFGIWSIRYSGDGRELVAGTSGGSIVVFDIESRRTLHRIFGHDEDVNAVCFADSSSPHILYSGSDDTTIKVWDTRSLGDSREAGAFVGHLEGLTYIDSKGDGRYILSNGKEQSMKLWDLRMVMSPRDFKEIRPNRARFAEPHFDYRWNTYDEDDWYPHPRDNSVVTFRGHKVLRTLIRCHFSPPASTNSRYVYSGSEDGKVYIWNMDATLAGIVDVYSATKNTMPYRSNLNIDNIRWHNDNDESHTRWKTCVRDASWHPNAPMIAASAWSGYGMTSGTLSLHSFCDGAEDDEAEPKMGLRVNAKLEKIRELYGLSLENDQL
ncbi:hypothetical protein B7494_g6187 [Chlorociboria aeruginascens]|nr:hypothetical protein B7494_g6187 [Chlorociboria aeruginascens]